jgi:Protein of unknown function (DUF3306)
VTAPESFISRWARLKHEADAEAAPDMAPEAEASPAEAAVSAAPELGAPPLGNDAGIVEPFDPASLPSVDAITFDTDIRPFLHGQVPAALTRAALRQAWTSDPAIRDFIGIAENQWDFNDPGAIPGFGPLLGGDNVKSLFEQAIGLHRKFAETVSELPISAGQRQSVVTDQEPTALALDRTAPPASDGLSAVEVDVPASTEDGSGETMASKDDDAAVEDDFPSNRRSHGSALPR